MAVRSDDWLVCQKFLNGQGEVTLPCTLIGALVYLSIHLYLASKPKLSICSPMEISPNQASVCNRHLEEGRVSGKEGRVRGGGGG